MNTYIFITILLIILITVFITIRNTNIDSFQPVGSSMNPEQYMGVPSFEPEWMKYNWMYYDPIRYKYGYRAIYPYFVLPYRRFMRFDQNYL